MVASKKKTTFRSLTARLLILGDKQVGKSASIVRYTTGRYIEQYSQTTTDWLYRHSLGFNAKQNSTTSLELLEQKDIHFTNSSNFFANSTSSISNSSNSSISSNSNNSNNNSNDIETITSNRVQNYSSKISNSLSSHKQQQSLASRVALDQQNDNEMHEKQQLLNKLHWANAYIVIYAINDISTFNKAIRYLNLIANNINSPLDNHQSRSSNSNSSNNNSGNSSSCSNISPNSNYNNIAINNTHSNCNGLFNRLSPINSHQLSASKQSPNHHLNNCSCSHNNIGTSIQKRPILLLANKRDLEKSNARQVSSIDGRMLAMRHQAMFVELSIAESNKLIESTIDSFIDQIDWTGLHIDHLGSNRQQELLADIESQPKLVQWSPDIHMNLKQAGGLGNSSPVWATLVKSQAVGASIAQSNRVASTRHETDIRLIKPIGSVAKSVETRSSIKPLLATSKTLKGQSVSSMKLISASKMKPTHTVKPRQKLANSNKYENLKSSFRRASMAIVSGKTLARSLTKITSKQSEKDLIDKKNGEVFQSVSSFDSVSEPLVEPNTRRVSTNSAPGPTNWIRSHIRLNRIDQQKPVTASSSDPKLNSSELPSTTRFKKPLFKYKNRAQTGFFERIVDEDSYNDSAGIIKEMERPEVVDHYKQSEIKRIEDNRTNSSGSCGYTSTRCSSARSSSSLSNGDTSYGSSFLLSSSEKVRLSSGSASGCLSSHSGNQQVKQLDRRTSRPTLSRASTSGGSCEETSGDEMLTDSNTTINSRVFLKASSSKIEPSKQALPSLIASVISVDNNNNIKKKQQLVKSVQGTLTNLTRSSNVTAKKSFCGALFKHSIIDATAPVKIISIPAIKQK